MILEDVLRRELGAAADAILPHMVLEDLAPGAVLVEEQAPGDRAPLFLVLEGEVEVSAPTPEGGFSVRKRVGEGELLGVLSALDAEPRSATCRAVTRARVARLPAAAAADLGRRRDPVGLAFLEWLGRQMVRDLRGLDPTMLRALEATRV